MKRHPYFLGFIISAFLVTIFLFQYLTNITKPLSLIHGDAFLVNFILKHWMNTIFSGNWSKLPTLPMFYGFKNSLFFTDHHFIQALLALPFFLVTRNIITTTNILVVMTILLSIFSMYALAWHFTKRVLPSLLAAVIFVLNPFIFARFPDQLILLSLQWIPLIFLFLEKSLDNPSRKNTFLFFLFLTCQLLSSLYYSVFLTVILPIYLLLRFWQKKVAPRKLFNRGLVLGLIIFSLTVGLSGYFYYQVFSKLSINRNPEVVVPIYSARPTDYFFTSPSNLLYGGLKEKAVSAFPQFVRSGIYSEHNLFFGIVPLVILVLSFKMLPKSPFKNIWRLFLGLLLLSLILSFGPQITLTERFSFPGPYFLVYLINPLFPFLRTAARFGVFVFFFLALISSLVLTELTKRLPPWRALLTSILVMGIVLLEYWNRPLGFTEIYPPLKEFYAFVNSQSQIKVILDLPIGNRIPYEFKQARAEDLDAHYLLWATILHGKQLFNGYTGFLPAEYYRRADLLSVNFPVVAKLRALRQWGVDGIILHWDEFNDPADYDLIKNKLITLGVPLTKEIYGFAMFDLTGWK